MPIQEILSKAAMKPGFPNRTGWLSLVLANLSALSAAGADDRCVLAFGHHTIYTGPDGTNSPLWQTTISDALGRQIASQDARGAVRSRAYDEYGRIAWESDPATNTTWYAYDAFGRVTATTNALGQVTHNAYDIEGRTIATWGATYPVEYEYDAFGRMITMRTFRDAEGPGDETRWFYDEPTGLLTNKLYADGKGTTYTYTPDGKLASRIWARGVTTTYTYTNGSSLTSIEYSDDTPEVTFTYDRMGRLVSAQSGNLAYHYAYDPATLSLVSETIVNLQRGVSNTITRTTDNLGRNLSLSLNNDYKSLLHYDDAGRLAGVAWQVPDHANAALYHYVEGGDLSAGWSIRPLPAAGDFAQLWEQYAVIAATSPLFTHERGGYDLRGLVGEVANSTASSHYYDHDSLGRRTARADSGTAYPNAAFDRYGYNSRSEVISGKRYYGSDTARPYGGRDFGYQYDAIGNRLTATEEVGNATLTHSYAANELNQYTAINNPMAVGLRGEAISNATVTVNQTLAASDTPSSDVWPWHFALEADNAISPDFPYAEIIATLNPPNTNGTALVATQSGHLYAPPQEEGLTYDDDGNLIQDARYLYDWDAENRLIAVEERISPTNRSLQRVEYDYDHQSRRVARRHYTRDGATWQLRTGNTLIYDGWNEIAESITTDESTVTNYYVWGADLSGSLQGAGGIGGLIAATIATNQTDSVNLAYGYDANGNVTVLLAGGNESPYTLVTAYEYDPFGRLIAQRTTPGHETIAKANPFRFSTKHWDNVTGLGYWGYRWYGPNMGRWLSRDPIGEVGGYNLVATVRNELPNVIDFVGLDDVRIVDGVIFYVRENFWGVDKDFHRLGTIDSDGIITLDPKIKHSLGPMADTITLQVLKRLGGARNFAVFESQLYHKITGGFDKLKVDCACLTEVKSLIQAAAETLKERENSHTWDQLLYDLNIVGRRGLITGGLTIEGKKLPECQQQKVIKFLEKSRTLNSHKSAMQHPGGLGTWILSREVYLEAWREAEIERFRLPDPDGVFAS